MMRFLCNCAVADLPLLGTDLSSGEGVALKLTFVRDNPELLRVEKEIYETLKRGVGIPRVH